jgi:hypothetical protein
MAVQICWDDCFGNEVTPAGCAGGCRRQDRALGSCLGGLLSGHARAAAAVTLGRTIVLHPDVPLTAGSCGTSWPTSDSGSGRPFTFPLHYAWLHLRHGYRDNPYEIEARAAEHD